MPLVSAFNLRKDDQLTLIEEALREAMISVTDLEVKGHEVDFVLVYEPDEYPTVTTRVNIDVWERPTRTKELLQQLATNVALAFQSVAGSDRKVKVVIRPYLIEESGWVSL